MSVKQIISAFLLSFVALSAKGQILTDGISGRDRIERLLFIQTLSPQGDTCAVISDTLGRFEIDPCLMDKMRGNVYLKPMDVSPKPRLTIDSPFDSIDVHRQGRVRYLAQNHVIDPKSEDPVFYYDPETTLLNESVVTAKRHAIARDKVTGYLDSLAIMTSGEWYCQHGGEKYLNDYHGYSHHPNSKWPANMVEHYLPKRGEVYVLVKYEPFPDGNWYLTSLIENFVYPGPNYTEEDLLKMNGMWKTWGYHPKREFYQPDELDLASPNPDYRNLLQWQPAVLTDENGVAEISFVASDVNTEFIGLIEAVDGMGILGCKTFSFRVIKN